MIANQEDPQFTKEKTAEERLAFVSARTTLALGRFSKLINEQLEFNGVIIIQDEKYNILSHIQKMYTDIMILNRRLSSILIRMHDKEINNDLEKLEKKLKDLEKVLPPLRLYDER